jgi:hypothetical protein
MTQDASAIWAVISAKAINNATACFIFPPLPVRIKIAPISFYASCVPNVKKIIERLNYDIAGFGRENGFLLVVD